MNKKKTIKLIILIVAIVIGIILGNLIYKSFMKNKMKDILEKNNFSNYELIENSNGEEIKVKVRDKTILSESNFSIIWESQDDKKRVIMDKNSKIALIAEKVEDLKINNINSTYITNYFDDSNQKFKYLGKEENYYKFEFTNKNTGLITQFYLNKSNNVIEKVIETIGNSENIITYTVKKDCVSKKEIEYPDLTGYNTTYSSSSGGTELDETPTIEENNISVDLEY